MADNTSLNSPDTDFGYGQLLGILVRRSGWLLGTMGTVLLAALFVTLREKPQYQSSMQLLVEPNYEQKLSEEDANANKQDYATQLSLMKSSQFVERTVDLLESEYPDLTSQEVQESLRLSQVSEADEETKIFQAVYVSDDPLKTQKVLETLKNIYQEYNLNQQEQRLKRGLASINEQLQVVRQELLRSQSDLRAFRQEQNLIDPEQQAQAIADALNKVIQEQQSLQAQYQEVQSRYSTLQQQLALSPESALVASRLSQSSRYQTLLNQIQQTELDLAQRRATFSDADPSIQTLLEQRQNQLTLLQQEIQRTLGQVSHEVGTDSVNGESILSLGQLSEIDLGLVADLAGVQATINGLQARQQTLAQTEKSLRSELNRFPDLIAQYDRLKPEVDIERAVLEQLLQQQQEVSVELVRGGFNWQVVEPPVLGYQVSPNPKQNMLLGAVVGLFLGGLAAFLRESMDDVIHTLDDLDRQGNVLLLGALPVFQLKHPHLLPRLLKRRIDSEGLSLIQMVQQPLFRESLDLIYKNVQLLSKTKRVKSLLITSAQAKEGKSTLAFGLAVSAARLHQRVLLIDANLRSPILHAELGLSNDQGLTSLLASRDVVPNPVPLSFADIHIHILPVGTKSADPVRLLSSPRLRELITLFEKNYDLVILDASSVLGIVDALQIASICSGTILVSRLDQVTRSALQQAIDILQSLNLLGVVANASRNHVADISIFDSTQPELVFHDTQLLSN